ncbi:MAG: MogA/MoaB family molybdenum cofactor biosynthesis protein [Dehalococcoidia bacterium]|nr:MogA/MoaB family molybdenum cofactor biosynthesis protein [Dehalococcoidia bacterium]
MTDIRVAVLVASDSGAAGDRADRSGKLIEELVAAEGWIASEKVITPDDRAVIAAQLRSWADDGDVALIVTTGGTGVGPRDVTPEATLDVVDRLVPGMAEQMRAQTFDKTPMAMTSRQVVGIRGQTLIVNLPGSPKAVQECLDILMPVLPHVLEVLTQPRTDEHPTQQT